MASNYYRRPIVAKPISTYSPYNIEFVQGQLDKSQNRYDLANQAQAKAFALLNEVDVAENDEVRKKQLIDGLHQKYNDIDSRYNGNLAAASSEITNFISNSRRDDFWKRSEYALKQEELFQQEKAKLGPDALIGRKPVGSWDEANKRLRPKSEIIYDMQKKEDWLGNVNKQFAGLKPSSLTTDGDIAKFKEWQKAAGYDTKTINGFPQFMIYARGQGVTLDAIEGLINDPNVANSFLQTTPSFGYASEHGLSELQQTATQKGKIQNAQDYMRGVLYPRENITITGGQQQKPVGRNISINNAPDVPPPLNTSVSSSIKNPAIDKMRKNAEDLSYNYEKSSVGALNKYKEGLNNDLLTDEQIKAQDSALYEAFGSDATTGPLKVAGKLLGNAIRENASSTAKSSLKSLEKYEGQIKSLQKSVDNYIYNGGTKEDLEKILNTKEALVSGINNDTRGFSSKTNQGSAIMIGRVINHIDDGYLLRAKINYEQIKDHYGPVYNKALKTSKSPQEAYKRTVELIKEYSDKYSQYTTNDELYTGGIVKQGVQKASGIISTLVGQGNNFKNSTYTAHGSSEKEIIGTDISLPPEKDLNMNTLSFNFEAGTVSIKDTDGGTYTYSSEDIAGTELSKLLIVPATVLNKTLDMSKDGYGAFDFGEMNIIPITYGNGSVGYISGGEITDNKNSKELGNKTVTMKITSSKDGKKVVDTIVESGTPAQIQAKLKAAFGKRAVDGYILASKRNK